MAYKVLVIDDESRIRNLLGKMVNSMNLPVELVGEAGGVEEAVKLIKQIQPDILLLDVQMSNSSGFDLLDQIPMNKMKVIFVTAHQEYAIQAIKVSAIDYLLKPVDSSELEVALRNAVEQLKQEIDLSASYQALINNIKNQQNKKLVLKTKEAVFVVDVKDVVYCQSDRNYTYFYLNNNEKIITSKTLKEYEELLCNENFLRCHRSYIINLDYLVRYDRTNGGSIILKENIEIPLSRSSREKFLETLENL